jgi:GNAT superfamily N-acetyltransferase
MVRSTQQIGRPVLDPKDSELIYKQATFVDTAFAEGCAYPEALAVIEGNNPGWVFADDPYAPTAALVWAQGAEGFYLIGDPNSAAFIGGLGVFCDRVLEPRLRAIGMRWCEISGDEGWDPVIERAFRTRGLKTSRQRVYALETSHAPAPGGSGVIDRPGIVELAAASVQDLAASNREFLSRKLDHFWASPDAFYAAGIGYLYLHQGTIVSLCFSGFVSGDTHAIDVQTEATYRRRGFAEAAGRAFVARGIERRLRLHWDCMDENEASQRLAERLGFALSHEYTLYSYGL